MDLCALHHVLVTMAACGRQHVAPEWLASFEAFERDVRPVLDAMPKHESIRLYRYDNDKPWSRANCYIARPSGPKFPVDPALAAREASRLEFLRREARRQNAYAYAMEEAA